MTEEHMEVVASFLHRAVQIALQAQKEAGTKLLKDFIVAFSGSGEASKLLAQLRKDVVEFSTKFPLPGVPDTVSMSANMRTIEVTDHIMSCSPQSSDLLATKLGHFHSKEKRNRQSYHLHAVFNIFRNIYRVALDEDSDILPCGCLILLRQRAG